MDQESRSDDLTVADYLCDVKPHGAQQIEIKSRYPVLHLRRSMFDMDLFIFFPRQLGIDGRRYNTTDFIRNSKTYSRLSTPTLSLEQAIDANHDDSPIRRIANLSGGQIDEIVYEVKTLCNIFRRYTREARHGFERNPASCNDDQITGHLDSIDRFTEASRLLFAGLLRDHKDTVIATSAMWADETISIKAEIEFYKLHREFGGNEQLWSHLDLKHILPRLVQGMRHESIYRGDNDYPSVVEPDESVTQVSRIKRLRVGSTASSSAEPAEANEKTLYREGMLKKWSQSALYLTTDERLGENRFGHVAAAIAAAIAMSFAVFATVFANRFFPSYSVPWALLIVLGYIFKDRIKELVRGLLTAVMPRKAADIATRMIDPASKRRIGMAKSLVQIRSPSNVPPHVLAKRESVHAPLRPIVPADTVLHVHKRTSLHGKRLAAVHKRTASITEILRISIDEWLEAMDDPTNQLTYTGGDEPVRLTANRVYHLHMIVTLAHTGKRTRNDPQLFHYRLITTRNGVLRIENLSDTASAAANITEI